MPEPTEEVLALHRLAGALCAGAWREACLPYGTKALADRLRSDAGRWLRESGLSLIARERFRDLHLEVQEARPVDGVNAAFELSVMLASDPPQTLTLPIPDPPPPAVRFRSDVDGDLFMFSNETDAVRWQVFVHDNRGSRRSVPVAKERFLPVDGHHTAPARHAWLIDDLQGTQVEICRPGWPPAWVYPPHWRYSRSR